MATSSLSCSRITFSLKRGGGLTLLCLVLVVGMLYVGGSGGSSSRSASQRTTEGLQSYISNVLKPGAVTPLFIKGDVPVATERNVFRMPGMNYEAALPGSTRLLRLPMLSEYRDVEQGFRFPANPSILPHPTEKGTYLLSTQIATGWHVRGSAKALYFAGGYGWTVRNVWGQLRVTEPSRGQFRFDAVATGVNDIFAAIDTRMASYRNATLVYGAHAGAGSVLINTTSLVDDTAVYKKISGPHYMSYQDPTGYENKNWQAITVGDDVYWMAHFSPLTVLNCGTHSHSETSSGACVQHAYHSMHGSLLPPDSDQWRGSNPFLPLPGFPQYLLSTIHQRANPNRRSSTEEFHDFYAHRFVVLEADTLIPFAFSTPFTLMADVNTTKWFEFVTGAAYYGRCELILTFGFNDQEPWLTVLEMGPIIASLLPTFESNIPTLSTLQRTFMGENFC